MSKKIVYCIEVVNTTGNPGNLYIGRCSSGLFSCLVVFDRALKFYDRQSAQSLLGYFEHTELLSGKYIVTEHEIVNFEVQNEA